MRSSVSGLSYLLAVGSNGFLLRPQPTSLARRGAMKTRSTIKAGSTVAARRATVAKSSRTASTTATTVIADLRAAGNASIATHSQGFFKTHPGGYGEGDVFLGIRNPVVRDLVKRWNKEVTLDVAVELLAFHEVRLFALVAMTNLYRRAADDAARDDVYRAYLANWHRVNNWDLVDLSAPQIVGQHLVDRGALDRGVLYEWARSDELWKKRIAMLSTFTFIRNSDFDDALAIAAILRDDDHDLIHKAVGWMLREVGNRDLDRECAFLDDHFPRMPRTMLRYAIEKFPEDLRLSYLKGTRETTAPAASSSSSSSS